MTNHTSPLADFEREFDVRLPAKQFAVVRVDGRAFHTFTRQYERPFSLPFAQAMNNAALRLAQEFTGTLFAYVQSDEISVVLTDRFSEAAVLPYSGRVQKLVSISAAVATAGFIEAQPETRGVPVFDGRAFTLPQIELVEAYLDGRHRDATKNAVTMAAEAHYSHSFLHGKSMHERMNLLEAAGAGLIPEGFFHGRLVVPTKVAAEQTIPDGAGGTRIATVQRTVWDVRDATRENRAELIASFADH
jgi:tRNA(His) guanylyltransferase